MFGGINYNQSYVRVGHENLNDVLSAGTITMLTNVETKHDEDFWNKIISLNVNVFGNVFICVDRNKKQQISKHVEFPPPEKKIIIGENLDDIEELITTQNIKSLIVHNDVLNFDSMFKLRNISLDYALSVLVITDTQREEEPNTFFADTVIDWLNIV